jgi:hypothetical protein
MKLHFNMWAPDSSFADAFNAALTPAATPGANQTYAVQVDHVEVNRINTTASANLLSNPSFEEDAGPTFIGSVPITTTGEWLGFGGPPTGLHVTYEIDDIGMTQPGVPDMAHDGFFMGKMFGPFNGPPDASGMLQNIPASPGEQFEARAWFQAPSGDTIDGTANFNTFELSFHDAAGNAIETNKSFPVLDGRDPNLVTDAWVEAIVNGLAPAGTAFVRVNIFFIQLQNQGGASWVDDVSLVRLTPDLVEQDGDFNRDGIVDAADYVAWRKLGLPETDYNLWRQNFGEVGGGSGAGGGAVPEPGALLLAMVAFIATLSIQSRFA